VVWLGPAARVLIDALPRTDGRWVFPDKAGGPRRSIGHYWRVVREQAGFPDVRLHDLRHTFASHAVSRECPPPVVARLLGHKTLAMTMRYVHADDKEAEAAAAKMGDILDQLLAKNKNYRKK